MYKDCGLSVSRYDLPTLVDRARSLVVPPGTGGSWMSPSETTLPLFWETTALKFLFRGSWIYCTVVHLFPSQQLVGHRDAAVAGVRYHIPLQVNPGCWAFHAGTWQQLKVGRVYSMDPTEEHGAVNWGSETRLHLIIDVAEEG